MRLNEKNDGTTSYQCNNILSMHLEEKVKHNMRYVHFENHTEVKKLNNVARLLRATTHAEYVHTGDHYRELKHLEGRFVANSMAVFGPGDTKKNLKLAIAGEKYEIEEMYPTYIEVAKKDKFTSFE